MLNSTGEELIQLKVDSDFDPDWYESTYSDVKLLKMDPAEHYLWIGRRMGRASSSKHLDAGLQVRSNKNCFETALLLESTSDIVNPARKEDGFDARSYALTNLDLRDLSDQQLYDHWRVHGLKEARLGSGVSPYALRRPWNGITSRASLKVAFYGPVSALSGLGSAARGYVNALSRLDLHLEVIDSTASLYLDKQDSTAPSSNSPDVIILHQNPDSLGNLFRKYDRKLLDDVYVIGIWVWEVLAFRSEWTEAFGAIDEVWTPSTFVTEAIDAAAPLGVPVRTIPHVVEVQAPISAYQRSDFGIPDETFAFLCIFDASSAFERKNPLAVLDAFTEAFKNDPAAFLVMKFHSSDADFAKIAEMRLKYAASNIVFLDRLMKPEEVAALRERTDCLVSAHRSEGFGLNIAEAMAIGKPVIVTGYSGNLEFCNETNSLLVSARLCEVQEGTRHYPVGSVWAQPDHDELVCAMRRLVAEPMLAHGLGHKAAETIRQALGRDRVAGLIEHALNEVRGREEQVSRNWPTRRSLAWRHPGALASRDFSDEKWPKFSVIVPVYNISPIYLRECVESILAQTYPHWELCICDDASSDPDTLSYLEALRARDQRIRIRRLAENGGIAVATNAAVEMATGEFLAFVDNDDTIEPDALEHYAAAAAANPDCALLYCDEDKIDLKGKYVDHYFKPGWSPEHLESCMYILHMLTVRKRVFLEIGGYRAEYTGAQDYDLALTIARSGGQIVHVPRLLYHWRMIPGSASAEVAAKPAALINARRALEDYAAHSFGPDARVEDGLLTGLFRISRGHLVKPPITLVMTTNNTTKHVDGRGEINLPENFLRSIIEKTEYPNYRVVISSNGKLSSGCRSMLEKIGGREIIYTGNCDEFNFADKANFSMLSSDTEFTVLLNDDMEIRNREWLGALVDQIVKEDVGAVGGHLCYPNDRIQHVGMVVGINETSAHVYHGHPGDSVGYNGYSSIVRNYSAVTGACLATRRSLYERVGGFDRAFAIDFNDTDFCLKLGRLGYRIVFTPFARLYHFESQTAVRSEQNPQEKNLFLSRWRDVIENDPYYNQNLRKDSITFEPLDYIWPNILS
jgi:GT2 family glycosyltransferase/glycosyltransferase involved in cell wall biosynthesis